MSKRDPLVLLEDILVAIQKIARYTSQMHHDAFLADELVVDAVARNLEIIGEATRQLPEEFRRLHTEIPWTQIAGLRNRIVHDYFGLDLEIIWKSSSTTSPSLRSKSWLSRTPSRRKCRHSGFVLIQGKTRSKHFAFTRCGELNVFGMVDEQIAVLKSELLS